MVRCQYPEQSYYRSVGTVLELHGRDRIKIVRPPENVSKGCMLKNCEDNHSHDDSHSHDNDSASYGSTSYGNDKIGL